MIQSAFVIVNGAYWLFDYNLELNLPGCRCLIVIIAFGFDGYLNVVCAFLQFLADLYLTVLAVYGDLAIPAGLRIRNISLGL